MKRGTVVVGGLACAMAALAMGAAVWGAATESAPAAKVTIKPLFQPGKYVQVLSVTSDVESTAESTKQPPQHLEQTMEVAVDISKPDASGQRTMRMKYRRIKMTSAGISFDSDKADEEQNPMMAGFVRPLLKADIVIKIDSSGRIDSAEGMDRVWDDMAKSNPDTAEMTKAMKKSMGDAYLKSMLEVEYMQYPDKPVAVGDQWQPVIETEVPFLGPIKVTQKCQLQKIEATPAGKVATFTASSEMVSNKPTTSQMGPATMTVKSVNMKQEGDVRFNIDIGLAERRVMTQTGGLDVAVTSPDGETVPVSMTFKMKMESTMAVDTGAATPAPAKTGETPAAAPKEK
jgi:hypothetical protein